MPSIELSCEPPKVVDAIALYLDAGWNDALDYVNTEIVYTKIFEYSSFITAYHAHQLIGLLRYITDKSQNTYIIECLVLKDFQRQGVGTKMLQKLIDLCKGTSIHTHSTDSAQLLYEKNGFKSVQKNAMMYTFFNS